MADTKISALTALSIPVSGDLLPIVDISDTTMAASGTNKYVTFANLEANLTVANLTGGTATGSGNLVRVTSPTLVTPTLGVATATSINKVTITSPATSSTLTIADGKTLTVSNTITLAGTDGKGIDIGAATSGKILIGDGSNMVLSTPTFPTTAGTSGNVLTSNGTNWVSSAPTSSGDMTVWQAPGSVSATDATIQSSGGVDFIGCLSFSDGAEKYGTFNFKVPSGATSISSIKIYYNSTSAGTLRLVFYTSHFSKTATTASQTDVTDTEASYTGDGTGNVTGVITVPSGAYNGLSSIVANDIISVKIIRYGASVSDTYNTNWEVIGAQITFA